MRLTIMLLAGMLWGCAPEAPETASPAAPQASTAAATTPATGTPAATDAATARGAVISEAWVRQVPPAARMTAGYLTISNRGTEPLVIVGAESPAFGSVEVHGTLMNDGMASMREQDSVPVGPGETVRFEPGGLHLMLMQPTDGVPGSGEVAMALLLENGERLEFMAPVGTPED